MYSVIKIYSNTLQIWKYNKIHIPQYTNTLWQLTVQLAKKWVQLWFASSQHLTFAVKDFISGINLISVG